MVEKLIFMSVEDDMATFERENGSTIIHPIALVPDCFMEGDIINTIIYCEGFIEFLTLDFEETKRSREEIASKKNRLRNRIILSTNA